MAVTTASWQPTRPFRLAASEDAGKLLLRLVVGLLILLHGIHKVVEGPGSVAGLLAQNGWPGGLAYVAYVGEVIAPVLLIAGFWTRPAALLVAINMIVAIALAHRGDLLELDGNGGWALELQALYLFGAIVIVLLGPGRLSIDGPP